MSRSADVDALIDAWATESVATSLRAERTALWASPGGVIGYVVAGRARVAIGSPACDPRRADELRRQFSSTGPVVFFGRELAEGEPLPTRAYVVGEQPWWSVAEWPRVVASSRNVRAQIRRAASKGVRVVPCEASELESGTPIRLEAEALVAEWLRTRPMAPMQFVAAVSPFEAMTERRYFVAREGARVVGLLVASRIPARPAWVFDHVLRTSSSPNGTAEALIDAGMRALASQGAVEVTLGLAPLSGRVPAQLALFRRLSRGLFDFTGLYDFKAKLEPQRWQRVLVEHPRQGPLTATLRALRAFAGGSLTRFAWRSALRCPPPLLRVLALAIVPWLALLATSALRFPFAWEAPLRFAFAALFSIGLLALARRIQRRRTRHTLHRALVVAAGAHALASLLHFVAWNVPHASDVVPAALMCVASASAALLLASGLRFRPR